ncbi:glutathione synthetase [Plasmodium brasilianum]|uniref:Glutathione synthetase (GS) n=2 Tax=Plasmodium (Plasmodium) TaxID=418103 RepID=A0A1A8WF79_PLAMA|nr:glutathione synthetase, putative [Plasmodium malariae]KAI4837853.1 glutathione synthetase [Plasmodium brasilianum]SBS91597.1 glutathione synthetase (GS) [Plasmodium malariae]SCN44950.1 glutathione synthetase, putative [Plasmodium malariae]
MENKINEFYEIIQKEILNYFTIPRGKNEYLSYERIKLFIRDLVDFLNTEGFYIYTKSYINEENINFCHSPKLFSFTLLPQKLEGYLLELCKQCTLLYAELFDNIVCDLPFLLNILKDLKEYDAFTKRMIEICQRVYLSGSNGRNIQNDIRCVIGRSDYMTNRRLNGEGGEIGEVQKQNEKNIDIKQIEYNTISVAFGNLSSFIFEAHKNMIKEIYREYFPYFYKEKKNEKKILSILDKKFDNNFLEGIISCISKCHEIYTEQYSNFEKNFKKIIISILDKEDLNNFDKNKTKCELQKLGIGLKCFTITELQNLFEKKKLFLNYTHETVSDSLERIRKNANPTEEKLQRGRLFINMNDEEAHNRDSIVHTYNASTMSTHNAHHDHNAIYERNIYEVSVIYFRSLYTPNHFNEIVWTIREMIEYSDAVKIPSLPYQLVGCKRMQMLLLDDEILKKYISINLNKNDKTEKQIMNDMNLLKKTFALQVDPSLNKNASIISRAIENANNFLLKPQREGGKNNLHGQDVKDTLMLFYEPQEKKKLCCYVLMQKLFPSSFMTIHCRTRRTGENHTGGVLSPPHRDGAIRTESKGYEDQLERGHEQWKGNQTDAKCQLEECYFVEFSPEQSISEISLFHNFIFCKNKNVLNEQKGYLVRTKNCKENEGGAICGISSLDSFFLT